MDIGFVLRESDWKMKKKDFIDQAVNFITEIDKEKLRLQKKEHSTASDAAVKGVFIIVGGLLSLSEVSLTQRLSSSCS
jgi:hypothetical protein